MYKVQSILDIWGGQTGELSQVILCHLTCHPSGITTQIVQQIIVFLQMSISHRNQNNSQHKNLIMAFRITIYCYCPFHCSSPDSKLLSEKSTCWNIFRRSTLTRLIGQTPTKEKLLERSSEEGRQRLKRSADGSFHLVYPIYILLPTRVCGLCWLRLNRGPSANIEALYITYFLFLPG